MSMIFFTFRAQTQARKGTMILSQAGLQAKLGRTPAALATGGCGYGIWVPEMQGGTAAMQLRGMEVYYEKSYLVSGNTRKEVFL